MHTSVPRRGIERKILTSILWVGILPLTIALAVGVITAREGQGNAVKGTLLTAAQTTTAGIRIACEARLRSVLKVSLDPVVIGALTPNEFGVPRLSSDVTVRRELTAHLDKQASADAALGMPSTFRLYDAEGHVVLSTRELSIWRGDMPLLPERVETPIFLDLGYIPELRRYVAFSVTPVLGGAGSERVGFIAEIFDAGSLLKYALGFDPFRSGKPSDSVYQFFYESDSGGTTPPRMVVSYLQEGADPDSPVLAKKPIDPKLEKILKDPEKGHSGTEELFTYQAGDKTLHVLLAYDRLFDGAPIFIGVYRPAREVFAPIGRAAAIAFGCCIAGLAVLCLNAYRTVHNNIVRPVLLLNEGAQIIGQGDLELKLKIGTGDEIEELATSFNKMALDLKANIKQVEESEERYRNLVTSMRDGIFQTDKNGVILFLNPAGIEVLGFDHLDVVSGQNLRGLFLEGHDLDRFTAELEEKGFVERSRVMMLRRDSKAICVELSGNLIHDDEHRVVGMEGIFRDVTESVRLERAARERAERLSAISQIANVINSSLEAGRLYDSLVVEVKKLVNFDHAELSLLNDRGDSFVPRQLWPEQRATGQSHRIDDDGACSAWVARRRECLVVDDLTSGEWPFVSDFPEGTRSCLCVPLYATGRIIGTLNLGARKEAAFSSHDVEVLEQMAPHVAVAIRNAQLLENLQVSLEEVTRAREKLHDANEELKTLDEMKTNLLSNVSHELRTPLVSVMGYTDMIFNEKVGPVTETQKDYLGITLRNIEKLVTLIENLLDFSRLHRGAETLVFDAFDLVDCARTSLQIVRPVADSREIRLDLIAPEEEVPVEGDKGKIGQVFNNLLSNAVKFNKNGGSVTIEIRATADSVDAIVRDTGIGIPEEALDKVFTRFYQYDSSSTRKYGGTGIGLAISQDIVRLHGSRLTISSEVGVGSTFRFSLPLRRPKGAGDDADALDALVLSEETHLLVELVTTDRALSNQVRALLGSESMEIIHAGTGSSAVSLAQKYRPDCIILDVETDEPAEATVTEVLDVAEELGFPVVLLTNDDDIYAHYRERVASRVKRGFRKSSLLSGIQYALHENVDEFHHAGTKVLCVDDDPEILTFIVRCLENEGYEVDQCRSGEEALQRLTSREYGLVLLDIAMPGMDGWEVCRRIKTDPNSRGVKVHMVTAKPIDTSKPRVQEAAADGFLAKPFRPEDLTELVRSCHSLQPSSES
ncbi:MAG: response regulator [bacterium]|nr:response regulator [bacterium]